MGEMNIYQAQSVRDGFVNTLENIKADVEMNFNDMDFENARQREEMGETIASMKRLCEDCISTLRGMSFS